MNYRTIIFYDGDCAMCNSFVVFLSKKKLPENFYFASQSGKTYQLYKKKFSFLQHVDSIVVIEEKQPDEVIRIKSTAVINVLQHISPWYKILKFFPAFIRDLFYDYIARNRRKIHLDCPVFPEKLKGKLLD